MSAPGATPGAGADADAASGGGTGDGRLAFLERLLGREVESARAVALGGVGLLMLAYSSVLFHLVDVSGNRASFLLLTVVTLGLAATLSRVLTVRRAVLFGGGLLSLGLTVYVLSLPRRPPIGPLVTDAFALMTGRSLLLIANVDLWVLGVAPAPLFLTWYFALRRWYVTSTLVGGGTLGFLVLTGNAGVPIVLLGVVGGAVAVAVGDIDRRDESLAVAEPLAVLLAGMILLSGVAPVVPAGPDRTYNPWSGFQSTGGGGADTVEANLIDSGTQLQVLGNISLSPKVRFSVESTESSYWRIGSYDRYTGSGWVRTGGSRPFPRGLSDPPGESRRITQTYEANQSLSIAPAAWRPVGVDGPITEDLRVATGGGLVNTGSLERGDRYTVRSRVPVASPSELRESGADYPDRIEERYLKVPSSTPDRVERRTGRITANADNPYDTAQVVERWLERNKRYSLNVSRPEKNVADTFIFERQAGYCVYFATAMVVMLRTQGIPARFTVGYTPGERVASDEWVVRGYDAHAWVEVYFEDVGWVRFDPTPAGPRQAAELRSLNEARAQNVSGVDTDETEGPGPEWTPTPTPTPAPLTPRDDEGGTPEGPQVQTPSGGVANVSLSPGIRTPAPAANGTAAAQQGQGGGGDEGRDLPSREEATLGAIVVLGVVVGLRRLGFASRLYRAVWLRYQPREDPVTDAERAFDRLEYVLEKRHRPRKPTETPRQYLASVGADERARQVALVRERARYAGSVTREEVDDAISLVDDLVSGRGA